MDLMAPRLFDCALLLIEDQRVIAGLASQMLSHRLGCQIDSAGTLAEAKALIAAKQGRYFLAVSDLHLPDAEPAAILACCNAAQLPMIAVTGNLNPQLRKQMLERGVVDYVVKDNIRVYRYVSDLVLRCWRNRLQHVLVVDDSKANRKMLKAWLERQFLRVSTAADGLEALQFAEANPDLRLLLTDCQMPRMDGINLVTSLRRKLGRDRLSIIGISASDDPDLSARFLKLGANDYLNKPFSYEALVTRVNQNLEMLDHIEALREVACDCTGAAWALLLRPFRHSEGAK